MRSSLQPVGRFDRLARRPACRDHLARATARPSFVPILREGSGTDVNHTYQAQAYIERVRFERLRC